MPRFLLSPLRILVLTVVSLSLTGALTIAQQTSPSQDPTTDQKNDQSKDQQPSETLKVNVNVVQLFFNVKDKHGALIPNLTKDDFEILEDGKPQTIKYFTAESNLPLTLGIMIDASAVSYTHLTLPTILRV